MKIKKIIEIEYCLECPNYIIGKGYCSLMKKYLNHPVLNPIPDWCSLDDPPAVRKENVMRIEIGKKPNHAGYRYWGYRHYKSNYFHFIILYLHWFYVQIGNW